MLNYERVIAQNMGFQNETKAYHKKRLNCLKIVTNELKKYEFLGFEAESLMESLSKNYPSGERYLLQIAKNEGNQLLWDEYFRYLLFSGELRNRGEEI